MEQMKTQGLITGLLKIVLVKNGAKKDILELGKMFNSLKECVPFFLHQAIQHFDYISYFSKNLRFILLLKLF